MQVALDLNSGILEKKWTIRKENSNRKPKLFQWFPQKLKNETYVNQLQE